MTVDPKYREFLTAENCALLLVDHQTGTMLGVQDIRLDQFRSNVLALASLGVVHGLPVVLTATCEWLANNQSFTRAAARAAAQAEARGPAGDARGA